MNWLPQTCIEPSLLRYVTALAVEHRSRLAGVRHWDVAWKAVAKYRREISPKSILKNISETVPTRIYEAIGKAANGRLDSPEIAIGYVMVFNVEQDTVSAKLQPKWSDIVYDRLNSLCGKKPPSWTTGIMEHFVPVKVDFSSAPVILRISRPFSDFFDTLVSQVVHRDSNAIRWFLWHRLREIAVNRWISCGR